MKTGLSDQIEIQAIKRAWPNLDSDRRLMVIGLVQDLAQLGSDRTLRAGSAGDVDLSRF